MFFLRRPAACLVIFFVSTAFSQQNNKIDLFQAVFFKFKTNTIDKSSVENYNKNLKETLSSTRNLILTELELPEEITFDKPDVLIKNKAYFLKIKRQYNISRFIAGTFNYDEGILITKYFLININDINVDLRKRASSVVREDALNDMYREITNEIISFLFDKKANHLFFSSIFIPGLGQLKAGSKTKGMILMSSIAVVLGYSYYIGTGDPYNTVDKLRIEEYNGQQFYGFGDIYISEEDYFNELDKNVKAADTRSKAKKLRNTALLTGVFLYLYNLYDILNTTKKLDTKKLEWKIYDIGFNFSKKSFYFSLNLNLDRLIKYF